MFVGGPAAMGPTAATQPMQPPRPRLYNARGPNSEKRMLAMLMPLRIATRAVMGDTTGAELESAMRNATIAEYYNMASNRAELDDHVWERDGNLGDDEDNIGDDYDQQLADVATIETLEEQRLPFGFDSSSVTVEGPPQQPYHRYEIGDEDPRTQPEDTPPPQNPMMDDAPKTESETEPHYSHETLETLKRYPNIDLPRRLYNFFRVIRDMQEIERRAKRDHQQALGDAHLVLWTDGDGSTVQGAAATAAAAPVALETTQQGTTLRKKPNYAGCHSEAIKEYLRMCRPENSAVYPDIIKVKQHLRACRKERPGQDLYWELLRGMALVLRGRRPPEWPPAALKTTQQGTTLPNKKPKRDPTLLCEKTKQDLTLPNRRAKRDHQQALGDAQQLEQQLFEQHDYQQRIENQQAPDNDTRKRRRRYYHRDPCSSRETVLSCHSYQDSDEDDCNCPDCVELIPVPVPADRSSSSSSSSSSEDSSDDDTDCGPEAPRTATTTATTYPW